MGILACSDVPITWYLCVYLLGDLVWHLCVFVAMWGGWVCTFTSTYTWWGIIRETEECAFCRHLGFGRAKGMKFRIILLFLNLVTWDKARAWKMPLLSFSPMLPTWSTVLGSVVAQR